MGVRRIVGAVAAVAGLACLACSLTNSGRAQTLSSAEYADASGIYIGNVIGCGIEKEKVAPVLNKALALIKFSAHSPDEEQSSLERFKKTVTFVIAKVKADGGKNCSEVRRTFAVLEDKKSD
jgi:hypothetical protein